mmetsp:Transcript_13105/g.37808  ORF Transcript_13105/g.37808 Transcript_13105/m.37808 type:complete len:291 (+) Transcript_13105:2464-3336(+)
MANDSPSGTRSEPEPRGMGMAGHVESMFPIQVLSRVDLMTSLVGALICVTFIQNEAFKEPRDTPFPWEQAVGMIFTTSVCPAAMMWNFRFYEKWRNVLVILLRVSFMAGTLAHYDDVPHYAFDSWGPFIGQFLIKARCMVICWGGFGWLLPFRYHIWMQGLHALLAFHLIPETCALPSAARPGTFLSLNEDRWRTLASVLDWPLVFFGGTSEATIQGRTSAWATCVGLNMWCIVMLGWAIPSLLISFMHVRLSPRIQALLRRDGLFLLVLGGTLYWILLRICMASVLTSL